jgi:Domain of unknown function (DUF4328)
MQTTSCPRCGEAGAAEDEFCATCGLPRDPKSALLPTPASFEAAQRNAGWLEAHPEDRQSDPIEPIAPDVRPPDLATFRDPEWAGRWAEIGLALAAVACVMQVGFDLWHLSILDRDLTDPANAQSYLDSVSRLKGMGIGALLTLLICAVTFVIWTRRAYRNLPAVGAAQRFRPGWAVGGWVVPVLNLWRPKQVINDIWRAGDPDAPSMLTTARYEHMPVPRTITLWWALFLIGNFVGGRLWRMPTDTLAHDRAFTERDLLSSAIDVVALGLALMVVRSLTRRQQARARSLAALPGVATVPELTGLQTP